MTERRDLSDESGVPTQNTVTLLAEDNELHSRLQQLINSKTKPLGSLGILEDLALQIGMVFKSLSPAINNPQLFVLAADHGIAAEGVSAYPQEVTGQMVANFLSGGAAINVFCRQHNIELKIVDAGVNHDFDSGLSIIDHKAAKGTASFLHGPAMQPEDLSLCFEYGSTLVHDAQKAGCNTIGFGEMGIGNTSSASVIMSYLCGIPLEECIGRGTGLADEQLKNKIKILKQASANYQVKNEIYEIMSWFGGFEIVQMTAAMLEAGRNNMLILVDGFIASVAFLCAFIIDPEIKKNAVFCHESDEKGHRLLLEYLQARPLLRLGMRLGEGTGCALAFPLIKSAVAFLNEMASFESAAVSNKA